MAARNILVGDDDRDSGASPSDILSDLGDTVDTANDGPAARELSQGNLYRLALRDDKVLLPFAEEGVGTEEGGSERVRPTLPVR
jgi:CheY-like chemotaxis protein